jgi:hypothetical protein
VRLNSVDSGEEAAVVPSRWAVNSRCCRAHRGGRAGVHGRCALGFGTRIGLMGIAVWQIRRSAACVECE